MNNSTAEVDQNTDLIFEELLDELTAQINAGELIDIESCAAAHPEYAERLQNLLPAMQMLVAFGNSQSGCANRVPSPAESPPRVLGDFRILCELGRGGMGVVYEAEQISLGRRLALKVLPLAATLSAQQLQRFKNEARAAATLKHPHVVGIHSVGVERGVHYYAMELIDGCSLAETVAELRSDAKQGQDDQTAATALADTSPNAALSTARTNNPQQYFRRVAQMVADAASAIEYAHSQGVVHRDIKPANLLVDQQSKVWVADFGLARLETEAGVTLSGDIIGTLRYMSPEQAIGKPALVDFRTDIHALGATLFELIAIRPPFESDDRAELLRQVAEQSPQPLRCIDPRIPVDLETIVAKAMEKDPADRYLAAGQLADDLRNFIDHRPIVAQPPSLTIRLRKWARRRPKIVAAAFVALALATIGSAVAATLVAAANHRAAERQLLAEENLRIAVETIDKLLARVGDDAQAHGQLRHADDLLRDAVNSYDQLLEKSTDPKLLLKAASARHQLSEVLRLSANFQEAHQIANDGLKLLRRLPEGFASDEEALAMRATLLNASGWAKLNLRDYSSAEWSFRDCLMLRNRLSVALPHDIGRRQSLLSAHNSIGVLLMESGRVAEGEAELRAATTIRQTFPQAEQNTPERLNQQAGLQANLASIAVKQGNYDAAIAAFREAIALQRRVVARLPEDPAFREHLYQARWSLADALVRGCQHSVA
ncbi:protein kinase, partial [Pirellulales bacterium]|nr:protein kinase [Pirellulales bacterium]